MSTFAEDIEEAAGGQPIESIVIGEMGWRDYGNDERHAPGLARKGEVLTWAEARPLLDYEYDTGYGAPDCQEIQAWTVDRVLYVHEYDGSTCIASQPRRSPEHVTDILTLTAQRDSARNVAARLEAENATITAAARTLYAELMESRISGGISPRVWDRACELIDAVDGAA